MKKEIIEDIVVLVLNLIVLIGITTVNVFYENIQVGNIYVTYTSIIAALALIVLLILRNNSKLTLALNIARIDTARLITILTFNFYYISLTLAFAVVNHISFMIALIIISCEVVIMILSFLISINNISYTNSKLLLRFKDVFFFLMVIDLIFNNVPFSAYSIPMDQLLISVYVTFISYFIYVLFKVLKPEL